MNQFTDIKVNTCACGKEYAYIGIDSGHCVDCIDALLKMSH